MTANRRAKRDARARKAATGESYTAARRHTSHPAPRHFEADRCANCMTELPPQIQGLFCSELCQQTAEVIRYWRRISRDGRIDRSDVKLALQTQIAHLLAGGYPERLRRLPAEVREAVWERDQGRCRLCGAPGEEIDHISDSSPALDNLQLLCKPCHQRKTSERMVPASPQGQRRIKQIWRERVAPDEPTYLCDDEEQWAVRQRQLRKERKERLLAELAEYGYQRQDFTGFSWAEMWDEVLDQAADELADAYDMGGYTPDDDSGYGPYSYFAHAMAKDD